MLLENKGFSRFGKDSLSKTKKAILDLEDYTNISIHEGGTCLHFCLWQK